MQKYAFSGWSLKTQASWKQFRVRVVRSTSVIQWGELHLVGMQCLFLGKEAPRSKQWHWGPRDRRTHMGGRDLYLRTQMKEIFQGASTQMTGDEDETQNTLPSSAQPKGANNASSQVCIRWRVWKPGVLLCHVDKNVKIFMKSFDYLNTLGLDQ